MTRRARGEGGIRLRPDGRWEWSIRTPDGRRKTGYAKPNTGAGARAALRRARSTLDAGRPLLDERVRVGTFLDTWLTEVVKPHRSHGHWRNCESAVRLHIKPTLGNLRLSRLTAADVQRLVNGLEGQGMAGDSVRLIHASLRAALAVARRWGYVHDNVARLVEPIAVRRSEVVPFTEEELSRLLRAAKGDRLGAFVTVAVALGLRPGEARALTWDCLDLDGDHPSLRVRQAFSRSEGGERLGPAKTPRSHRVIALPAQCVEALRGHRRRQLEERVHAGPAWQDGDFVFTLADGRPLTDRSLGRWFSALMTKANVTDHRLYDLRHTAATLLLAQGVQPRVLMDVLGHSTYRLTMDTYAHVMPAALRETANAMDVVLARVAAIA